MLSFARVVIWRGVGESVCATDTLAKEISQSVCRRSRTRGVAEEVDE